MESCEGVPILVYIGTNNVAWEDPITIVEKCRKLNKASKGLIDRSKTCRNVVQGRSRGTETLVGG